MRVELDECGLDLSEHLAHRDAEHPLASTDEVDDLVVGGAQVYARPIAHERGLSEVFDARLTQLGDGGADLVERDAGVEQALHELQHEDVAEPVEPLRSGAGRTAHGGLDQLRTCPVVELAVADARRSGRNGAAIADCVVVLGHPIGEQQAEVVASAFTPVELTHPIAPHSHARTPTARLPRYPRRWSPPNTSGRTSRRVVDHRARCVSADRTTLACTVSRCSASSSARSAVRALPAASDRLDGAIARSTSAASRSAAARSPRRWRASMPTLRSTASDRSTPTASSP